jgi:hypothetical protein
MRMIPGQDASEGGSRTDGTYSLGSVRERRVGLCPVGRSLSRASSSLGLMPTCTDSAPPGLATLLKAAGPNEPGQSPTRLVSGYSLRLNVLPNAAIPPCPVRGPQPPGCRLFGSTTLRRTGSTDPACLAADKQTSSILSAKTMQTNTSNHLRTALQRLRCPFLGRSMHPLKSTVDNCTGGRSLPQPA